MNQTWHDAFKGYAHPRVIGMLFLGFSAGLPLLLVLGTQATAYKGEKFSDHAPLSIDYGYSL